MKNRKPTKGAKEANTVRKVSRYSLVEAKSEKPTPESRPQPLPRKSRIEGEFTGEQRARHALPICTKLSDIHLNAPFAGG